MKETQLDIEVILSYILSNLFSDGDGYMLVQHGDSKGDYDDDG